MDWLVLHLEAPLVAFGGVVVDGLGVTRDHPALSAIAGLLGNALGYDRTEGEALQSLQDRLILGSCHRPKAGGRLTDFHTVQLEKSDKGWTRHGVEGRAGSAATYESPYLTWRDYHTDHLTVAVVALKNGDGPGLHDLAAALDRPERPLFIGRKSCLPSARINAGMIEAETALDALLRAAPAAGCWKVSLPADQGPLDKGHEIQISDLRDWKSDLHGGNRTILEGIIEIGEAA